jgi:uncharacterized circularly permuted ATP-grasp superfamily protein
MGEPEYYDEVYERSGEPRPHYRAAMEALGAADLVALGKQIAGARRFLRDAYGERRIVEAGVVPGRLIEDGAFYEPDMQGVDVPVWVGFAGLDVVRGANGEFSVLEDNVRMPTGLGFAPLAWEAVGEVLDSGLPAREPRAPGEPMERLLAILRATAPEGREDPSIVVLGDGFENDAREDVLGRLGDMVVKVRDRVGGEGVLIGPEAEDARGDIGTRPQDFIAQEAVELSCHPTLFGGELAKRRIDLRSLIASSRGEDAIVLGGLTRVALGENSKVVNMAQGGGVKATWTVSA